MAALTPTDTTAIPSHGGKYLTFALGREEYGLPILKVREIIGLMDITAVPGTPSYVRGVINLRGQVIAIVDLRSKFCMPSVDATDQTCIIVVVVEHDGIKCSTGLVVDRVSEVLEIPSDTIEDPPGFTKDENSDFILGMGKVGNAVKILLDIDRILSAAEFAQWNSHKN
ncbi:MAG TPA: chemotaxis protein CheW [Phycisphaerae bacterium]|nr:chemotaxis protein CheW [Phycisphaerae bacterium]